MKLEKIRTEKIEKEQGTLKESITALDKKLRRKQNENFNLMDNIEKLTKVELDRVAEIYDLKKALKEKAQECSKLCYELAVKTKEQIDNIKVRDLESELEDLREKLKGTTDDLRLHKEKLKLEIQNKPKIENKHLEPEIEYVMENQSEEIVQLNDIISRGDKIIKEKDKEIFSLKKSILKDQEKLRKTEGEYSSLRCMMTEENETIHQIQQEMSRLLKIISDDQEAMIHKDKIIQELRLKQNSLNITIREAFTREKSGIFSGIPRNNRTMCVRC